MIEDLTLEDLLKVYTTPNMGYEVLATIDALLLLKMRNQATRLNAEIMES